MKVLVTGGKGLLAHAIQRAAPPDMDLTFWDVEEFDLTQPETIACRLASLGPELVINTAAYNWVDRCEVEQEAAWAVNAKGPETLAGCCAPMHCRVIHFSSDYVFDGAKNAPYVETDTPNPLNQYGAGKLYGETAVLRASPENLVLRTSWLFGPHPTQAKSYVHSVLRQARAGSTLRATTDQVAVPTHAPDLARWTIEFARRKVAGLFHAVNDEGLSRYEWTLVILATARKVGLLNSAVEVEPALTASFNPSMRRPNYSVLSNGKAASQLGAPLGSWRKGLEQVLREGIRV